MSPSTPPPVRPPQGEESTPQKRRLAPGRVPVQSRDNKPATSRTRRVPRLKWTVTELAILVTTVIVVLYVVATPLANYYHGRTEIARAQQAIADKTAQKEQLLADLERYNSPAYQEEQARNRLHLIREGEVAFRIMDPGMDNAPTAQAERDERYEDTWWEVLWDSIQDIPDPPAQPPAPAEELADNPDGEAPAEPADPAAPAEPESEPDPAPAA